MMDTAWPAEEPDAGVDGLCVPLCMTFWERHSHGHRGRWSPMVRPRDTLVCAVGAEVTTYRSPLQTG